MKTDRRGFIGALLALPFVSRLAPHTQLLRTGGTLNDLRGAGFLFREYAVGDDPWVAARVSGIYSALYKEKTSEFWYPAAAPLKERIRARLKPTRVAPLPS